MQELVQNACKVVDVLGVWPSFHDAEVHTLTLDRFSSQGPVLQLVLKAFRVTKEITPAGSSLRTTHALITLQFVGIALLQLADFNEQNVLWDLTLKPLDPQHHAGCRLAVEMDTSYGMHATFECVRCEVAEASLLQPPN